MSKSVMTLLLLFVTATAFGFKSGERERAFVLSLELFDTADSKEGYLAAARELETILESGMQSGAVYYNLGNAYYRAGEYGRAILNYRKAMPYRPRDAYLKANLDQALSVAPGRLEATAANWTTHLFFWTDWMSYPQKAWLTSILLSGAAILFASATVFRRPRIRQIGYVLLVISIPIGLDLGISASDMLNSRRAVITGETTARKGTAKSYEPAFDQPLRDGAEFTVLSETGDWTFGHFENIGDGWVRNEFVAR